MRYTLYFLLELVYTERTHMKKFKVMLYVSFCVCIIRMCMQILLKSTVDWEKFVGKNFSYKPVFTK